MYLSDNESASNNISIPVKQTRNPRSLLHSQVYSVSAVLELKAT